MNNEKLVKMTAFRVAFLMAHQEVCESLELEAMALMATVADDKDAPSPVNKESAEYLAGASDALISLVACLKQKGCGLSIK